MAVEATEVKAPEPETMPSTKIDIISQEKAAEITKEQTLETSKEHVDVETGSVAESVKGYYSKLSVWLMVLFSGLAIGSDG